MANPKPLTASSSAIQDADAAIQSALRTLDAGVAGVSAIATALQGPLGPAFTEAVEIIQQLEQVGRYLAAKLALVRGKRRERRVGLT